MALSSLVKRWIYPPDWQGSFPDDGERTSYLNKTGYNKYVLQLTRTWDATEDYTDYRIIDISTLRDASGKTAVRTCINKIKIASFGVDVILKWDRPSGTVSNEIVNFSAGTGQMDFTTCGPRLDPGNGNGLDGTGDIMLTTVGGVDKDSIEIEIDFKVKSKVKP